jgi:hypothetical protein
MTCEGKIMRILVLSSWVMSVENLEVVEVQGAHDLMDGCTLCR